MAGSDSLEGMQVVNVELQRPINFQAYKNDVHLFPKELVENVPKLYLPALNMELTISSKSITIPPETNSNDFGGFWN